MSEMSDLFFRDIGELFDGPHATPKRIGEGPYFLNISSLDAGRLDLSQSDHVSDEEFKKWTRRVTPQEDDLLFSYETRLGEAALMPGGVAACLGRRMALLRPDRERIVPRFLLYYYLSPHFQDLIQQRQIQGATVPRIGLATMGEWPISIPSLEDQRAIADVLGALDDKIAANERLLLLNSRLANALYKCAPKSKSKPLSSVASFMNGRAFTKNATGTGRVVIRIAELNSGIGSSTVLNDIRVDEANLARPGDLLFAWSGSLTVARWYDPEAIVNQHIFKVESIDGSPLWLVRELLNEKLDGFKAIAADKATTMGHIRRSHLDEPVLLPEDSWLRSHFDVMTGFWELELELELESRRLACTRDELLPLLMSGKISVKDAEKVVSDAV